MNAAEQPQDHPTLAKYPSHPTALYRCLSNPSGGLPHRSRLLSVHDCQKREWGAPATVGIENPRRCWPRFRAVLSGCQSGVRHVRICHRTWPLDVTYITMSVWGEMMGPALKRG
jgi:hypothetical protein